jgi:hypothetical protein
MYRLVMLCILWPSKLAMVGSLLQTGGAVAQHMWRDASRQITQRGDP